MTTDITQDIIKRLDTIQRYSEEARDAALLAAKDTFNIRECALFLGIAVQTVYTKCCRHELPHYKQGSRTYFAKEELRQWMRGTRISTDDEISQASSAYTVMQKLQAPRTRRSHKAKPKQ